MKGDREYYDIELKWQSKKLMQALEAGIKAFDVIVHDRHESRYFKGQLAWRNRLHLRVSIPKGQRWEFIKATKIWLHRPPVIGVPAIDQPPKLKLKGNHNGLQIGIRRTYRLHRDDDSWIKNFTPTVPPGQRYNPDAYELIEGVEALQAVLDGGLDRVLFRG